MKLDFKSFMRLAALGAAGTLGMVGSGHAALYAGTWDPAFGPAFPGLGWRASGALFVADDCRAGLAAGHNFGGGAFSRFWNPQSFATAPCVVNPDRVPGAPTVELRDVRVEFYNLDTNALLGWFLPDVYRFGSGLGSLLGVEFDASGVPVFFETSESVRRDVDLPPNSPTPTNNGCGPNSPFSNFAFSAQLSSQPGAAGLTAYCSAQSSNAGIRSEFTPRFVMFDVDGVTPIIIDGVPQARNSVPEPGSFALAGLALMLAAAARRKQRGRHA